MGSELNQSGEHLVTRFKGFHQAIKQLEPFVKNPQYLQTGREIENFGRLRPREVWANILICLAANAGGEGKGQLCPTTDPTGGDGVIHDPETGHSWRTEHVIVPALDSTKGKNLETLVLDKIDHKQSRGAAYGLGKILVVFLSAEGGPWHPNRVAKRLPTPLHFLQVWVVGLQCVEAGDYLYNVALLDLESGNAPTRRVRIGKDFDSWSVGEIQS